MEKVDLKNEYELVWETTKTIILPSYAKSSSSLLPQPQSNTEDPINNVNVIHQLLHDHFLHAVTLEESDKVCFVYY